jgi:hypothetical protein
MIDPYRTLDRFIFGLVLTKPSKDVVEEMIVTAQEKSGYKIYEMIDEATGDLDAKASALLNHISIMIAITTFLFSRMQGIFGVLIGIEFIVYLALAILCLRVVRYTWTFSNRLTGQETNEMFYTEELYKRGEIYNFTSRATIVATLSMIVIIVLDIIAGISIGWT